jgi:hypothetical protein
VLPLDSWLLRLLQLFDYQNSCLLFLKLQVQDQNDYFWQTVWGLFSKILPTFILGISCLTVWICQIKFYALILFICGFLFICDLVICNLNFSSVIWGVKQTPGKWMLGCIECRWICPSRFVYMFIFLIYLLGVSITPQKLMFWCFDSCSHFLSEIYSYVHLPNLSSTGLVIQYIVSWISVSLLTLHSFFWSWYFGDLL